MSALDIVVKRRSIRSYIPKKEIPTKILDKLKEALIWAPSAGNLQARKFYFVFKDETKSKLAQGALGQDFIARCSLVIVCCADLEKVSKTYGKRGEKLYSICDVSASIQNMLLAATENGLGTCWISAFNEAKISQIMNLSESLKPIALVTVGYPNESPEPPKRVSKEEAVEEIK